MISKGNIMDITLPESDLTVGWLLSEVTRRYEEQVESSESIKNDGKVIIGLRSVETIPTLDYYLTHLENSLSQVGDKLLVAHFAEINKDYDDEKDTKLTKKDFQFLKVIGCGGYSNVVLARLKRTGKLYAIKIIKKDATYLKTNKSIYLNEMNIMRKLTGSPFIVSLCHTFQTETELYFAMEPCIGGTLFHFFSQSPRGSLNKDVVKFYASEIIVALEKIHLKNIMYRDLKPENVLIDIDGHVKLSDFGLSKQIKKRSETSATF
jgi:serine/threonine protein kinase